NKTPATLAETTTTLTNPDHVEPTERGPLVELDAEGRSEVDAAFAGAGPLDEIWPLTPLQEGFLFHTLYDGPGAGGGTSLRAGESTDPYLSQMPLTLTGDVDAEALRTAVQALVRRHPNLRAGFLVRRSGEPVQVIPAEVTVPWHEVDLTGIAEESEREQRLRSLLDADRSARFDPVAPPLMRVTLVKLA
ncbi:condensation domain-containing protein, partial [Streptomyces sp. KLOTTS4A1]|uniref:condensation domain-containing protein n=1 Tax=Streptomyces sp. KLOTTS4A1 TaxID=3390996 RepID=UPI0039F469D6